MGIEFLLRSSTAGRSYASVAWPGRQHSSRPEGVRASCRLCQRGVSWKVQQSNRRGEGCLATLMVIPPLSSFNLGTYNAVLFDMDGVVTDTASLHAAAWKTMFDEYLQKWSSQNPRPFRPFTIADDYRIYVDGKPR